jgi:hypothetical protein
MVSRSHKADSFLGLKLGFDIAQRWFVSWLRKLGFDDRRKRADGEFRSTVCYCAKIELSTTFDDDDKVLICFCCWRVACSMVDEVDLLLLLRGRFGSSSCCCCSASAATWCLREGRGWLVQEEWDPPTSSPFSPPFVSYSQSRKPVPVPTSHNCSSFFRMYIRQDKAQSIMFVLYHHHLVHRLHHHHLLLLH